MAKQRFRRTTRSDFNVLWASGSVRPSVFKLLNRHQKINRFPRLTELARKDTLLRNVSRMQQLHGRRTFNFLPDSYCLPEDSIAFRATFEKGGSRRQYWIVKPCASSQGRGIAICTSLDEVIAMTPCIVSRYIEDPLLIDGHKFDIRLYVAVTSFDPMRVYMYDEGRVSSGSPQKGTTLESAVSSIRTDASTVCRYTLQDLDNRCVHLTNTAVNKHSPKYDDEGHKRRLSALWDSMQTQGLNTRLLRKKIKEIIIKAVVSVEPVVNQAMEMHNLCRGSCFALLGFDIMIDRRLRPWLLEVNQSPSLSCHTETDRAVKSSMLIDLLNMTSIKSVAATDPSAAALATPA
ncbi:hypothetical protein PBRA_005598 [Plasmodiophora brassicae]|nr:hypothetical protein PBRA_005598 [Plasmodiophora brassicae]